MAAGDEEMGMLAQAVAASGTRAWWREPRRWLVLAALLLAFCFLGNRGLYDPDEGRYTNVALTMLDNGDWVDPQRNADTGHWTKPPLTYWAIAASASVLGEDAFAVRLPMALSFLACIGLCAASARRLAPGRENLAALAYMTMLMPFGASQLVTTDFLLAAFQALAMFAFVRARFDESGPGHWPWLMSAAFALAFLTKGPPALLPLLAVLACAWLAPSPRPMSRLQLFGGVLLFLAIALPWFVVVAMSHQGLLAYFLGSEVVARVATNDFARHGEWYGWAEVYIPTLLLGSLPWTLRVVAWARGLPAAFARWRDRAARQAEAEALLLASWVLLPLAVFCIARSRLPLYLLPLFVPLALVVARQSGSGEKGWLDWRVLALWFCALLGLRIAAANYPSDQDASAWAKQIVAVAPAQVREVVFVEDMPRYGLHLYLDAEVETLSLDELADQPRFNPEYDESLATEIAESADNPGVVYVTKKKRWDVVRQHVSRLGFRAVPRGEPFHGRILFVVARPD
jgi:4-amino-4-deoxy-L-arabinose transferase-like glycosyltransferase